MLLLREASTIRYCDPEFEIICKKKGCNETHYYKDLRIANTKRNFPEIVVLCGSTRFIKLFDAMSLKFTLEGKIVLSVGTHYQSDHGSVWEDKKPMLDELHKRKIDLADKVFVINKNGYIGYSTRSEINYATMVKKPIEYMELI